jgi:hypothetical protein
MDSADDIVFKVVVLGTRQIELDESSPNLFRR